MSEPVSQERQDGALVNVLTGMGLASKDKTVNTSIGFKAWLTEGELEALYRHGIPRRYVDAIADEILRHKTTVVLGAQDDGTNKEIIESFETYLKNIQFHAALSEVIKLQRLYGGAGIVMLVDDGLEPEEPVDLNRVRAIRGFVPLSRWELIPEDFTITDYSKPSHYRITTSQKLTPQQEGTYVNVRIHSSRVARFDGLYLPWNERSRNTGWGQSVLQLIWEAYKRYESAMSGLENLASDSDLFIHKIPGLFQRIASGNESDLRRRLEANNLSRSIYGGMVVDTEEDVAFLNRSVQGISAATDPFISDLQAATGWPSSLLMGESPGGLGKEGRYEERVWASLVEQWQEVYCRTPINEIFTLIFASREGPTRGRTPASWSVNFPSVFTQTEKEQAELRAQIAQSDFQYMQMGVLNALEVRESRFAGAEYSIDTNLNEAITQQEIIKLDMQFQSQVAGMQAQVDAAQNPPQLEEAPPNPANEEGSPPPSTKKDSFEVYDAYNVRIRVTHELDGIKVGVPVGPDNQRIDSTDSTLVVLGPHRLRSYKIYRVRIDNDGELTSGPYVMGFASLRAAKQGIKTLFPRQNVAGLSLIPPGEVESLRAGWEAY